VQYQNFHTFTSNVTHGVLPFIISIAAGIQVPTTAHSRTQKLQVTLCKL